MTTTAKKRKLIRFSKWTNRNGTGRNRRPWSWSTMTLMRRKTSRRMIAKSITSRFRNSRNANAAGVVPSFRTTVARSRTEVKSTARPSASKPKRSACQTTRSSPSNVSRNGPPLKHQAPLRNLRQKRKKSKYSW
uniref:(northern house mosquito) hypothetical protein n=1 Tax=Culex pipiens TaxID=7175 RepID=A0A8D8HDN7_CULPI